MPFIASKTCKKIDTEKYIYQINSDASAYVSDVVSWSRVILTCQAAPIYQLKCQATRLAHQKHKQMHPTLSRFNKIPIKSLTVNSILQSLPSNHFKRPYCFQDRALDGLIRNGDCSSCSALATKFCDTELTRSVMNEKLPKKDKREFQNASFASIFLLLKYVIATYYVFTKKAKLRPNFVTPRFLDC